MKCGALRVVTTPFFRALKTPELHPRRNWACVFDTHAHSMEAASDGEGEETKTLQLSYEELQPSEYEDDDDHVPKRMRCVPQDRTLHQCETWQAARSVIAPSKPVTKRGKAVYSKSNQPTVEATMGCLPVAERVVRKRRAVSGAVQLEQAVLTTSDPENRRLVFSPAHDNAPALSMVPTGGWLVVDLFCSIGCVSLAAAELEHTIVLAVDMDQWRLDVHAANHPNAKHVCMKLGAESDADVRELISQVVPADQWHRLWIHASPPCTSQSGIRHVGAKRSHNNFAKLDADRITNHDLVRWVIDLVRDLAPAQFSIEEVDDRTTKGTGLNARRDVRGAMEAEARKRPTEFAFGRFQMADYGVPQTRTRLIAARPATIWQLLHARALRVDKRVTVSQAMAAEGLPPPDGTKYIQGPTVRVPNPHRIRASPLIQGKFNDDDSEFYDIDLMACPTVTSGAPFAWLNANFERPEEKGKAYLTIEQTAVLMTVPKSFRWKPKPKATTSTQKRIGLANGIPPVFMKKVFLAATTLPEDATTGT